MGKGERINITPENFGQCFVEGSFEAIYEKCSKDFKALVAIEQFIEMAHSFNQGVESYQLSTTTSLGSLTQYVSLDNYKERAICVAFDTTNVIQSLLLKPYILFTESDGHYTKNKYIMPVKEEWFIFWGGTNEFINYHYAYASQRYAYDLVIMKGGQSYKDTTIRNENYYAFNKEVVAPADGQVVKVIDNIADNVPGEMNESQPQPAGNYVVIEHQNNEYSMLAHFKQHSIQVKEGDSIKQGQVIGLCGNSGNSSEPHIHFQVMNSEDYVNGQSIRIRFEDGTKPIQGDTVSYMRPRNNKIVEKIDRVDTGTIV